MERLQQEHGVSVEWLCFPLHPETPARGQTLEQLFAGRNFDIPAMLARLKKVADEEGLPFGERSMTFNSRRAQELGKWASDQGAGEAFHLAAFHAYFAEGKNLHQDQVLLEISEKCGLDGGAGLAALDGGGLAARVDADWERAREWGITAVPTFVAKGRALAGAYPYADLARFVVQAGISQAEKS